MREDIDSGPHRTWLAVGIEGLAPGFFEFEPTLYIRDGGHVAGRITGSYDLLITQRLIAQPEMEMDFYTKSDPQRLLGAGLSDLDPGIRVRYEINRKFAPYVASRTRANLATRQISRTKQGRAPPPQGSCLGSEFGTELRNVECSTCPFAGS